ncbi:hypothetical protein KI387_037872, partial [Taxus chinensis]
DYSEKPTEAPRITQLSQGQQSSSTVTSTSIDSGGESFQSMEQQVQEEMHQEDMEVDISSSTFGSKNPVPCLRDWLKVKPMFGGKLPADIYLVLYGKIFKCRLFGRPNVMSADPSFNRYILQNEGRMFRAGYPQSFRDLVGKKGFIFIHGDLHRKLHGIAVNLMASEKVKNNFITDIQIILQKTMGTWKDKRMFFEARRDLIGKICEIIDKWRCILDGVKHNGLLERLPDEDNISQEIVADFIISLLFAGHETTAKTMSFAIYFLTQWPEAVEQFR